MTVAPVFMTLLGSSEKALRCFPYGRRFSGRCPDPPNGMMPFGIPAGGGLLIFCLHYVIGVAVFLHGFYLDVFHDDILCFDV